MWRAALPVAPRSRRRRRLDVGQRQRSSTPRVLAATPPVHLAREPEPDDRLFMQRRRSATSRTQLPVPDHRLVSRLAAVARNHSDPKCSTALSHVPPLPGSGADSASLPGSGAARSNSGMTHAPYPAKCSAFRDASRGSCAGPRGERGHFSTQPGARAPGSVDRACALQPERIHPGLGEVDQNFHPGDVEL